MKITPSARILRMLGEIEFAEWQCIAELVDNAFDDFGDIQATRSAWPGGFKVSVSLPAPGTHQRDAEVVVRDTGRGMTREHLEQAVRAGWSNNDPFEKLGLFGMGFNVSTARLGRKTRVLTTRAGDEDWIGVDIDLDEIGDDFEVPDIVVPKSDPGEHGTRIEIRKVDPDRVRWLTRNAPALRRQLGHVYGWILDKRPYELWVSGVKVKPRRSCHWDSSRHVRYGAGAKAENIPALIEIDETYEPAETCLVCGNWQAPGHEACLQCESHDLRLRERKLHGWVGVQRYLDKSEFGVDFLRNGRKILMNDRRLFEWSDPNDPTAAVLVEYPVELGQGGRLIGEIHLDHVPVNYQKDSFEFSDRGWLAAVAYLRGPGPLLPQKAKQLGYPENDSPVGRLFKGYRRNDAGLRYLVPGDGTRPIHDKTREWARKFYDGVEEYQSDEVWWEAVLAHEAAKEAKKNKQADDISEGHPDEASLLAALGLSAGEGSDEGEASGDARPDSGTTPVETEQERISRYKSDGDVAHDLSGDFGQASVGFVSLTTRVLQTGPVINSSLQATPVWISLGAGAKADAFVDANHDLFRRFGWEYGDALLVELAHILKVRADDARNPTELVELLKSACLPDTALDINTVGAQSRELLVELRQRMSDCTAADPARAYQWLGPDEVITTENSMIADGARGTGSLDADTRFIEYAPSLYLVRLMEEWPEAFLDGQLFTEPYLTLGSLAAKRLALSRVTSLVSDVVTLAYVQNPGPLRLQRARLSVALLADELTPEQ